MQDEYEVQAMFDDFKATHGKRYANADKVGWMDGWMHGWGGDRTIGAVQLVRAAASSGLLIMTLHSHLHHPSCTTHCHSLHMLTPSCHH